MKSTLIRPGMTAIAAVIALSSTPLLAQEAAPQSTVPSAAPVQVTPPPVVRTTPSTEVPTSITTVTPQPAAPVVAPPAPVIDAAPAAPVAAAPVQAEPEAAPAAPVARAERRAQASAAAPRAAAPSAAPAVIAPPAPTPQAETTPLDVTPPPAAIEAAAPTADPVPVTADATSASDTLPLIGAGALAVLALGAAGFALTRRRRRADEVADEWEATEAAPAMSYAPAEEPVVAPQPAPAPVAPVLATVAPVATSDGEHGRHVQAAYAGPTEENPFVSLKKRLKRAHFLDMQEARDPSAAPVAQTARPAPAQPTDRYEVRRPAPTLRRPAMRPAFQG